MRDEMGWDVVQPSLMVRRARGLIILRLQSRVVRYPISGPQVQDVGRR